MPQPRSDRVGERVKVRSPQVSNCPVSGACHRGAVAGRRRRSHELAGAREAGRVAATLGQDLRETRLRRGLTLAELAERVGIGPTRLHELEAGLGATAPLAAWFAVGSALGRPFAAGFSHESSIAGPVDAGHLAAQELVLRIARTHGRTGLFELPTRESARDGRNVDVGLRDDLHRALILIEIWNRLDDLGSAGWSTRRKVHETAALAMFSGYRAASCWLFVDTAANRAIVRRYAAVLRAMFPGSSFAWTRSLVEGAPPPRNPGIAWIDPRSGRIRPVRLHAAD
jgi:transcriptional regulator with XRE-family HTH domain